MSIHSVTRRLVALVALAFAVLFALPASAGTLHTTDDAGVFTPSQLATLRSRAQGDDFDVRLITSSSYASKSDLGGYVHRFVTEPNIVVIGLDPTHHHVSVHFGTGTRIADSEFKAVESAGVASFKDSDWAGGVVAILDRAEKAVGTGGGQRTAPAGTNPGTSSSTGTSGFGGFFWIILLLGGVGLLFWIVSRRRASGPPAMGGYGGPPIGGYGGGPPVGGYGGPPVGPSYGGGGSGIGSNIASAGLGGLVGYELGKEVGEGHHHHYDDEEPRRHEGRGEEPPREWSGGGDSAEPGNYDAGGASGGWDDSSGGGSGDDSGGDSGGGGGGGDADF
jgi:hypothetical protein